MGNVLGLRAHGASARLIPARVGPSLQINKKAYFNYEILETYEAGIMLNGAEVKSIKAGQTQLKGSFVQIHGNAAIVENMHVSPYKHAPVEDFNPLRRRKLLLKKKEIDHLAGLIAQEGLTIIPLEIYLKKNIIKLKLGVCRGKKLHDKRATLKRRAQDREVDQGIKKFSKKP